MNKLLIAFLCLPFLSWSKNQISQEDLVILKNPSREVRRAIEDGDLKKMVRIIQFIEHKKIELGIFKDPHLVELASIRESQNAYFSLFYNVLFGLFSAAGILGLSFPVGVTPTFYYNQPILNANSFVPLLIKGFFLSLNVTVLMAIHFIKERTIAHTQLITKLVDKYHTQSLRCLEGRDEN